MLHALDLGNGRKSFYNATAHSINLRPDARWNGVCRRWQGGHEVAVIPPSGAILSASYEVSPVADLGSGVLVCVQRPIVADNVPREARLADYIIASIMYAEAWLKLYPHDPLPFLCVRDVIYENGKPIGCRGFTDIKGELFP